MLNERYFLNMLFDDPEPEPEPEESAIISSTDIEPAISIDHISQFKTSLRKLMEVIGVSNFRLVANGAKVPLYKTTIETLPAQVGEGEDIPLTKVTRKKVKDITITLQKHRKGVTAEAIQADGYENAVNDTDRALISRIRKAVKKSFFSNVEDGTGTGTAGATLQSAMANALAALGNKYEDEDVTPLFVLNRDDVYNYLGEAPVYHNIFGFQVLENFLGAGDAIVTSDVTAGKVWVTAKENLYGVAPSNGSDVANALGMTADESGLILIKHTPNTTNATLETLVMSGATFYAEDLAGVFGVEITSE